MHINRDVGEVYDYLKDLENTPEWNWAIVDTKKISEGPVRVGTRFSQTRSVPATSTEELTITALEENELIEVEGRLARFDAHLEYRLDSDARGTIVENVVDLTTPPALRVFDSLIARRIRQSVSSNLDDLRKLLENIN